MLPFAGCHLRTTFDVYVLKENCSIFPHEIFLLLLWQSLSEKLYSMLSSLWSHFGVFLGPIVGCFSMFWETSMVTNQKKYFGYLSAWGILGCFWSILGYVLWMIEKNLIFSYEILCVPFLKKLALAVVTTEAEHIILCVCKCLFVCILIYIDLYFIGVTGLHKLRARLRQCT